MIRDILPTCAYEMLPSTSECTTQAGSSNRNVTPLDLTKGDSNMGNQVEAISIAAPRRGRRSNLPPEQREHTRRLKKQNMERRRRACISDKMMALHNLAMDIIGIDPTQQHQRLEKADILGMCYHVFEGIAEIAKEKPDLRLRLHRIRSQLLEDQQTPADHQDMEMEERGTIFRTPSVPDHPGGHRLYSPGHSTSTTSSQLDDNTVDKENRIPQLPALKSSFSPLANPQMFPWMSSERETPGLTFPSILTCHSTPSYCKPAVQNTRQIVQASFDDSGIVCTDTSSFHSLSTKKVDQSTDLTHSIRTPDSHILRSSTNMSSPRAFKPVRRTVTCSTPQSTLYTAHSQRSIIRSELSDLVAKSLSPPWFCVAPPQSALCPSAAPPSTTSPSVWRPYLD